MGWILVNIVLPISLPLLYMLGAKLVDLSPEAKARAQLLRLVQDGQLGWVTMGYAASCAYEVIHSMTDGKPHALGLLVGGLTFSFGLLAIGGFLAALGTLFPIDVALPAPASAREWARRYRLFLATFVCAAFAATVFTVLHFTV